MQGASPVDAWAFASPGVDLGASDFAATMGAEEENPLITGPAAGYLLDPTAMPAGTTGMVHVNTGANVGQHLPARPSHWANALDYKHGPLFWLMVATILYFGLIAVRIRTPLGRVVVGR